MSSNETQRYVLNNPVGAADELDRLRRELAIANDELATFRLGKHHNENAELRRELAEAREWITGCDHEGHHEWCAARCFGSYHGPCTCGRDALLKKMEVPK